MLSSFRFFFREVSSWNFKREIPFEKLEWPNDSNDAITASKPGFRQIVVFSPFKHAKFFDTLKRPV